MSKLLLRRSLYTSTAAITTGALYYSLVNRNTKKMLPPYQATFSVPMHCDSCIQDISGALANLEGVLSLGS